MRTPDDNKNVSTNVSAVFSPRHFFLPTRSLRILAEASIVEHYARAPAFLIEHSAKQGAQKVTAAMRPSIARTAELGCSAAALSGTVRTQLDPAAGIGFLETERDIGSECGTTAPDTSWPETMRRELQACRTPGERYAWAERWARVLNGEAHLAARKRPITSCVASRHFVPRQ